jgi:hypothetical protein
MENRTHINIFDFDETLFRVPGYTCSEAKGKEPYEWFDSPESLDQKFNIRGIQNTLECTKDNCLNYLITHRVKACQPRVLDLLTEHKIRFDKTFFLGREGEKAELAIDLIREHEATSIAIFEDSLFEIIKYTSWFLDAGLNIAIDFIFVDKSKIIKIDWDSARSLEEFAEITRLKLI